ncbi:MAG: M36 family metallopeptidase, partial [Acidobacteriota bacterium]|nr:M36 family metallopeptidase [Acidobacteriota bacterium]
LFRLRGDEVDGLRSARRYRTDHNGVTHLTLQQHINNIEVFQGDYTFHLDRTGAMLAASGELVPSASRLANASRPRLSAAAALRKATEYADNELTNNATPKSQAAGNEQRQKLADTAKFTRDVEARLVYFPLTSDELRLAWQFEMWMQDSSDVYQIVVDADNGALLYRDNLTWYCFEDEAKLRQYSAAQPKAQMNTVANSALRPLPAATTLQAGPHGMVFTKDSPRSSLPYNGIADPPFISRVDLAFGPAPFNGTTIFPAGDLHNDWWGGLPQITFTSNNADAYLDRDANNQPDDNPRLVMGDGNFSSPMDFTQQPTTIDNQNGALANLFYWTNRYHDILYSFGFNEASGNFQKDNFGLGGVANDAIRAEAQDGSGTNNANFSTSGSDGSNGRMQMYLFTGGAVQRDGDLDQGIILHELSHGLSIRLVRNLSSAQGGGMGEGWSDYFGLVLLRSQTDDLDGTYPVGGFAVNDYSNGIRRFPYSTSSTVYPFNFGDISKSTEVHNVGEIWCNTLLEMRAALIRKLGYKEGQRQSLQLVVDGLKLTATAPTFVDARNGIMLADKINNGGANQCTLWQAFSKRGMGFSASTLDARDGSPQQEFDIPASCSNLGSVRFNQKVYLSGETINFTINDNNAAAPVRVKVRSSVTGDEETLTATPDATFAGSYNVSLRFVAGPAALGDGVLQASLAVRDKIIVTYDDANNGSGAAATVLGQSEVAGEKNFFDDMVEAGNQGWIVTGTPANTWAITESKSASSTHSWADSPAGNYALGTNASLVSPLFNLTRAAGVTLTFAHTYALTSGFDYGIVEYSTDDGATWKRATAFTGSQTSFTQALIKLDVLAGEPKARLRFRLNAASPTQTADGWTIDDIRIIARSSDPAFIPAPSSLGPMLAGVLPAFGTPTGGTAVTISGLNFTETGDVKVFFGNSGAWVAATNVRALGSSTITATTPAQAAGKASVRIETRYGVVTLANAFTYYVNGSVTSAPDIVSITPSSGSSKGGSLVTINGSNFSPETTVLFGTLTATKTFINANSLRVTTPAANVTGAVDVTARNSATAEKKIINGFNYTALTPPTVQVLTPTGGEQIFAGSTITLRWQSSDNRKVARHRIALYRSTSTTPQLIASIADVGGEAQSFNWTIPQSATTNAGRIRVLATDDEGAETEVFSSADFTIDTRWQAATQLPIGLNRGAVTNNGKYLYTIAGRTTTGNASSLTTVQRIDPAEATPTWEALAPLPLPFNSAKAVVVNGKIYVPGGIDPAAAIVPTQYVYDIAANIWATLPAPPLGVHAYSLAADAARNTFYLTGGSDVITSGFTNVQAYNIAANQWTTLPPMNTARFAHESVLANG